MSPGTPGQEEFLYYIPRSETAEFLGISSILRATTKSFPK